jgi:hypothetical protein
MSIIIKILKEHSVDYQKSIIDIEKFEEMAIVLLELLHLVIYQIRNQYSFNKLFIKYRMLNLAILKIFLEHQEKQSKTKKLINFNYKIVMLKLVLMSLKKYCLKEFGNKNLYHI